MQIKEIFIKEYTTDEDAVDVEEHLAQGDELRTEIPRIQSPLPGLEVRQDSDSGTVWDFYIYKNKSCIANFSIQPQDNIFGNLLAEGVMPMIPHMVVDPRYQGQGLSTRCYLLFLNNRWHSSFNYTEWVLSTQYQSPNAARLWSSIARQPGYIDFYYDRRTQKISQTPTDSNYRFVGPKSRFNFVSQ